MPLLWISCFLVAVLSADRPQEISSGEDVLDDNIAEEMQVDLLQVGVERDPLKPPGGGNGGGNGGRRRTTTTTTMAEVGDGQPWQNSADAEMISKSPGGPPGDMQQVGAERAQLKPPGGGNGGGNGGRRRTTTTTTMAEVGDGQPWQNSADAEMISKSPGGPPGDMQQVGAERAPLKPPGGGNGGGKGGRRRTTTTTTMAGSEGGWGQPLQNSADAEMISKSPGGPPGDMQKLALSGPH